MVRKQQNELENLFQEALRSAIGDKRYQLWFASGVSFAFEGNRLSVQVDTPFMADWINEGYVHLFKKIGLDLFGQALEIDVAVKPDAETAYSQRSNAAPSSYANANNGGNAFATLGASSSNSRFESSVQGVESQTGSRSASAPSFSLEPSSARPSSARVPADFLSQGESSQRVSSSNRGELFPTSGFASTEFAPSGSSAEFAAPEFAPAEYAESDYADRFSQGANAELVPAPPKRRRGRPRKNPLPDDRQSSTYQDPYQTPFTTPTQSAYQPARQTPYQGAPQASYSGVYGPSAAVPSDVPKRKRGRPRKNPAPLPAQEFPQEFAQNDAIPRQSFYPETSQAVPIVPAAGSGPASAPPQTFFDAFQNESQARFQRQGQNAFASPGAELSESERAELAVGSFEGPNLFGQYSGPASAADPESSARPQPRRGRPKGSVNRANANTRNAASEFEDEENVSRDARGFNVVTRQKEPTRVKAEDDRLRFASLNTFVEGFSNQLARRVIDVAIAQPNAMSPIFIYGPTSVGKTHLLEGVCDAYTRISNIKPPLYMTSEQFVSAFIHSLRGGAPFRDRFKDISLFALDDVHFLEGKISTQTELLNVFDFLRARRVQMVVSANKPLVELHNLRGELTTRLESGVVCKIDSPERETLAALLRNMARERNIVITEDVCRYVVSRFTNNARQLSGALNKLYVQHLTTGAPIDLQLAQTALADLASASFRNVKLEDVERVVQEIFGLDPNSLKSSSRAKKCADPRAVAMWIARKHTRAALAEIGQFFGGRKHSAVLSAQKKVDEWLQTREQLELGDGMFTVNDAVERVERALAASRA